MSETMDNFPAKEVAKAPEASLSTLQIMLISNPADSANRLKQAPEAEIVKLAQSTKAESELPVLSIKSGGNKSDGAKDSEHIDVGASISWSKQMREISRPEKGQGYEQVMSAVGKELLGRELADGELEALVEAGIALQRQRGKDTDSPGSRDELLPKNEMELSAFLDGLERGSAQFNLSDFKNEISASIMSHGIQAQRPSVITDTTPVKDQNEVTKVVPDAVYIDSSNIEGGQGYRRKEDCSAETQSYWLSKRTAEALMRAQDRLSKEGKDPVLLANMNGGGRRALDRELISKCAPDQPHAKKHSTHEDGISIDVSNYGNNDVVDALTREGFVHNVPGDRPHYTLLGKPKNTSP